MSIFDWFRREPPLAQRRVAERVHITNPYHAVTIVPGLSACHEARELANKRFLSREAPRLPLAGCSGPCKCRYRHFEDRRTSPRRAIDGGGPRRLYSGPERRSPVRGRRRTDD